LNNYYPGLNNLTSTSFFEYKSVTLSQEDDTPDYVITHHPEELLLIVDDTNTPCFNPDGSLMGATRDIVNKDKLWHRCSSIFVMDEQRNFYI
jgi:hypothetical protein